MIKITQVSRTGGNVVLMIEYSTDDGNETVLLEEEQLMDRLKRFKLLMGRKPTVNEAKDMLVEMINKIREGEATILDLVPWENYIGVDLE